MTETPHKPFDFRSRAALIVVILLAALVVLVIVFGVDTWRARLNPTAPLPPPATLDQSSPPATR